MPIKIQFSEDGYGLDFLAVGDVTGAQIAEGLKEAYHDERFPSVKYKIVDRTGCTSYKVSVEDVALIANLTRMAASRNPELLEIIVSTSEVQYGMSRMYEAQMGQDGFRMVLVRSREEAEQLVRDDVFSDEARSASGGDS